MTTDLSWVPADACTLPSVERPLRVAEFDALFADHLTGVDRLDDTHARLILTGGSGGSDGSDLAGRARDLADRETGCCSFFAFSVAEEGDRVRVDVAVPAAHAAVLEALVARAELQRRARA